MSDKYWRMTTEEHAERNVLLMLKAHLMHCERDGKEVAPAELLDFIKRNVEKETERMRKAFPEKE